MQSCNPILLVDDDPVNAVALGKVFHALGIVQPLLHARNGAEALAFLREDGGSSPDMILSDVNMPGMNGLDLLRTLKADPKLRKIPVIMFTTSQDERDIAESFALGAAGYMIKSIDDEQLTETIRTILLYWNISELPSRQMYLSTARRPLPQPALSLSNGKRHSKPMDDGR